MGPQLAGPLPEGYIHTYIHTYIQGMYRQSKKTCQPNFAALNRGRHLYSAGQPPRWALAHISSLMISASINATKIQTFQANHVQTSCSSQNLPSIPLAIGGI